MPPAKCREASMSALWHNPINESRKVGTYHSTLLHECFYFQYALVIITIER